MNFPFFYALSCTVLNLWSYTIYRTHSVTQKHVFLCVSDKSFLIEFSLPSKALLTLLLLWQKLTIYLLTIIRHLYAHLVVSLFT